MNNKVKIKIICRHPKKFLQELILKKINIYDLNIEKKFLEIIIDKTDLDKVNKIKLIHKIEILDYFGISKIKHTLIRYKILFILIIIGILINIILSSIVFNIEISTPNKKLEKLVLNDLKNEGLKKYSIKPSYKKKERIKKNILEKENNKIEWMEIEEHGTKYVIRIEERKINKKEENCYERNIVSKKNAVITRIESSNGEIVKKKNDYVEKNEVIISGLIFNKDKIVSKKCAIGKVYGETWYKVKLQIPKKYSTKKMTEKKSYGFTIKILDKEINFNDKFITSEKKEYNIIKSKIAPINLSLTKYQETIVKSYNYKLDNIDKFAIKEAIKKISSSFSDKPTIINKKVLKKQQKNSKIDVEVFIALEEDITSYQDIRDLDIEKMNEEIKE